MSYSHAFMRTSLYAMEVIFLYIVLFLFYFHTDILPPLVPYFIIVVVGAGIFIFLLNIMKTNTPYFFIMLFVPVLAYGASKLGFSFGLSLVLSALICWRMIAHYKKDTKLTEFLVLIGSLGGGFLIYLGATVQGYPHKTVILYLLIAQLLFLMISKVLNGFFISTLHQQKEETKYSFAVIGLFGLMVGVAVTLAIIIPFLLKSSISLLFTWIGKVFYVASVPFFNAVENAEFERKSQGDTEGPAGWETALEDLKPITDYFKFLQGINIWTVLSVIGLIILAVVLYFLAKKKFIVEPETTDDKKMFHTSRGGVDNQSKNGKSKKRQMPVQQIRRLIYELELLAASKGKGRYSSETVEEWLNRHSFIEYHLVSSYERVRYGEENLTKSEVLACEDIVKQLKSNLKTLKKI